MEPVRILIAEDDEGTGLLLSSFLNEIGGMEVVGVARDGIAALELLRQKEPDLLILDLVMPRMNGIEVLQTIHSERLRKVPKILVLSGVTDDTMVQYALGLGACHYIMKPVKLGALVDWIRLSSPREEEQGAREEAAIRWYLGEMGAQEGLGYEYAAIAAAALSRLEPDALLKEGYAEVQRKKGTRYANVERNIRRYIAGLHQQSSGAYRAFLGEEAGERPPSNKQFLFRLADWVRRGAGFPPEQG